jgi:hypothetical protein
MQLSPARTESPGQVQLAGSVPTKGGWHSQPPLFSEERPGHLQEPGWPTNGDLQTHSLFAAMVESEGQTQSPLTHVASLPHVTPAQGSQFASEEPLSHTHRPVLWEQVWLVGHVTLAQRLQLGSVEPLLQRHKPFVGEQV